MADANIVRPEKGRGIGSSLALRNKDGADPIFCGLASPIKLLEQLAAMAIAQTWARGAALNSAHEE